MSKITVNHDKVWILRPKPHGSDQMRYFLENNRISIGYPLGQSLEDCSYSELKKLLSQEDEKRKASGEQGSHWAGGLSNVNILVREMDVNDIVIVPHGNDIYFAIVKSNYLYVPELDEDKKGSGFPHQRKVAWAFDGNPISRNDLPPAVRDSLQFPGTAANIDKHLNAVLDILNESEEQEEKETDLAEMKRNGLEFVNSTVHNTELTIEQRLYAAKILLQFK